MEKKYIILISVLSALFVIWLLGVLFLPAGGPPALNENKIEGDPKTLDFGPNFVFGAGTSAWQVEKGVAASNWSRFETIRSTVPPHRNACCAMEHFDEDLEFMKSIGLKKYRFSVHWSALNPSPGSYDGEYLNRYRQMCQKLIAAGMTPAITLWHFEYPAWLEEEGGLISPNFLSSFNALVRFVVTGLSDVCHEWITVNEPTVYCFFGYLIGIFPPGHKSLREFINSHENILIAHVQAYNLIHSIDPSAKVSLVNQIIPFYRRHSWSFIEAVAARFARFMYCPALDATTTDVLRFSFLGIPLCHRRIPGLKDSFDFVGINHYTCVWISINPGDWGGKPGDPPFLARCRDKYPEIAENGWNLVPPSLAATVEWVQKRWNPKNLPIEITEHGIADKTDVQRRWFTLDSLAYLKDSMVRNHLPVTTYFHWSLLDNYEWLEGYNQGFGLSAVDIDTQERTHRVSATMLGEVAKKSNRT